MFAIHVATPTSCKYQNYCVYKDTKLPCKFVNSKQLKTQTSDHD